MNSKAKTYTFFTLALILCMSVGFKFFMGLDKIPYTLLTDKVRYPSNIARDSLGIIAWALIAYRLKAHRVISNNTFWAFTSVLIAQILDYFLIGGKLGAFRLLIFPITYLLLTLWKRK